MAYTILAGVPPVHGLYATMVGTPVGALTGSSQRMPMVPTAALAWRPGRARRHCRPDQRVAGLLVLTVVTGVIMLVAGLCAPGPLARFISNAVMVGFMAGVSVTDRTGQLGPHRLHERVHQQGGKRGRPGRARRAHRPTTISSAW